MAPRKALPPEIRRAIEQTIANQNTREQWLQDAAEAVLPLFEEAGAQVPALRVSCGWPGGGSKRKRIGECWPKGWSAAKVNEIFISPLVEDSRTAIGVLVHEMVHAVDDCKSKHGGAFAKLCKRLGMVGKMTQAMPGPELAEALDVVIDVLGPYPHRRMSLGEAKRGQPSSRKFKCDKCEFAFTASIKAVEALGHGLYCPACGHEIID